MSNINEMFDAAHEQLRNGQRWLKDLRIKNIEALTIQTYSGGIDVWVKPPDTPNAHAALAQHLEQAATGHIPVGTANRTTVYRFWVDEYTEHHIYLRSTRKETN